MRLATLPLFILLAMSARAQPWVPYQGEFYHPTGFPYATYFGGGIGSVIADFDGDGDDEYFSLGFEDDSFIMATRDEGSLYHWHWTEGTQRFNNNWAIYFVTAENLDDDPASELIVIDSAASCWKAVSSNPWTWERHDDLLAGLYFPHVTYGAIFGDYDGDGLLNVVLRMGALPPNIQLWERNSGGVWEEETCAFTFPEFSQFPYLIDGDFDGDGDTDFSISWRDSMQFYENTGGSIVQHCPDNMHFREVSAGGDLNGDGLWDIIYLDANTLQYTIVTLQPDPVAFLVPAWWRYVGYVGARVVGNLNTQHGPLIFTFQNFWDRGAIPVCQTDSGWVDLNIGAQPGNDYMTHVLTDIDDVDGDGLRDLLQILFWTDPWGDSSDWDWMYWPNTGDPSQDRFDMNVPIHRWVENPDTLFFLAQIGDITGDGIAEFAVQTGNTGPLRFYDTHGSFDANTYTYHAEWSAGLPNNINAFRLADITDDGISDVFTAGSGSYQVYIFQDGLWQLLNDVLPDSVQRIALADLEGDGDMDIFDVSRVWVNQLFTAADPQPHAPSPSSFVLGAYPNPFNGIATITVSLPTSGLVNLSVFNLMGRRVKMLQDGVLNAGEHSIRLDAADLPSGIYFARLTSDQLHLTQKLVLLK
jgi:hypothetical protein